MLRQKLKELTDLIERSTGHDGTHPTEIAPLTLYRLSTPSEPVPVLYEPALCIVAQGSKRVMLADEIYSYDPAQFLLVSVDLPLAGQVVKASPDAPYLSLRIDLDPGVVGDLLIEAGLTGPASPTPRRGLAVSPVDAPLLDAVVRLLHLLDSPRDIGVLAPLIVREITYRLLRGEQGPRLRQITTEGGQAQRIARAIHWLKHNYSRPFSIDAIAREAHMSPSGLHHHFKAVTAMSPLQYQKQLRLQEARRLMLSEALDAAAAGYRVGYESPSQFSREYRRLFGAPPQRDMASLRRASQPSPA
jgi:AraC-like DNA-binding protein